jgi:hypothetical protein
MYACIRTCSTVIITVTVIASVIGPVPTVGFQVQLYFITPVANRCGMSLVDPWLVLYYLYKNDNNNKM